MDDESAAWTLYGIEPADNTYRHAGEEVHRAFWRYIAQAGVARFRWRCNAGLDRHGEGLTGIKESTFRRGRWRSHTGMGNALNPPLVPASGRSRTEELIRGRGFRDHAEWYWLVDSVTGLHWGQVMLWHREGAGHLPVRDVIGWSEDDIAELRRLGQEWWHHFQHGALIKAAVERLNLPQPKTGAIPPPKFEVTGRIDIEHATFGIGGERERTARAIAEGYHSGFSRKTPGGHTYGPKKPPSAPPPEPPWMPRPDSDFASFDSTAAMERFGEQSYGDWAQSVSEREQYALKAYTAHNFKWMNARLRGEPLEGDKALPGAMDLALADRHIAAISDVLARGKTDRGIVTYRGVKDHRTMGISSLDALDSGETIPIESFGSSSLSAAKAEEFAGFGPRRVFFQIHHPPGSTGAYLNSAGASDAVTEDEFLAPPGSEYRVVRRGPDRVDEVGTTWPVVVLERIR